MGGRGVGGGVTGGAGSLTTGTVVGATVVEGGAVGAAVVEGRAVGAAVVEGEAVGAAVVEGEAGETDAWGELMVDEVAAESWESVGNEPDGFGGTAEPSNENARASGVESSGVGSSGVELAGVGSADELGSELLFGESGIVP